MPDLGKANHSAIGHGILPILYGTAVKNRTLFAAWHEFEKKHLFNQCVSPEAAAQGASRNFHHVTMKMLKATDLTRILSAMALLLALIQPASAAKDPIYTSLFSNNAAGGYDVTGYFTENRAVKGKKKYSTEYMGARWLFASQENLDLFLSDPEKYAPQYGGYCAWAAAQDYTAKGDPEEWSLHDGKLYLNYDAEVKKKWLDDKVNLIVRADQNWPGLLDN